MPKKGSVHRHREAPKKAEKPKKNDCLSLGIFVVVRDRTGKYLAVKHAYKMKKWSLPGGGFEQGEFFTDAGVREVLEESGLAVRITRLIGNFTLVQSKGAVIVYEAVVVGGRLRPGNRKEISACKFMTKKEAISLHKREKFYNAQLSAILWSEVPPRKDGLPHEGWLTIPPTINQEPKRRR